MVEDLMMFIRALVRVFEVGPKLYSRVMISGWWVESLAAAAFSHESSHNRLTLGFKNVQEYQRKSSLAKIIWSYKYYIIFNTMVWFRHSIALRILIRLYFWSRNMSHCLTGRLDNYHVNVSIDAFIIRVCKFLNSISEACMTSSSIRQLQE